MHANVGMVQMCKYKVKYQSYYDPIMIPRWKVPIN